MEPQRALREFPCAMKGKGMCTQKSLKNEDLNNNSLNKRVYRGERLKV